MSLTDDRTSTMPLPSEPEAPTDPVSTPVPSRVVDRLLRDTAYSLGAFPVSLVGFVVVVVGFSLGAGLLVLGVGLVVLTATVYAARGLAHVERSRMRRLLALPAPEPTYVVGDAGVGFWRRQLVVLGDPQSWLDLLWGVAGFVTGTVAFTVTVSWWASAAGGLTYWFWQQWLPDGPDDHALAYYLGLGDGRAADSVVMLVGGVALLLTLPAVNRLVSGLHAATAATLLCSRAELQREVRRVEGGREAARDAEARSLRRLERDIHDGPQQRLVRLSMDLGRARARLGDDAGATGEALDAAQRQARETLAELRALSRGIAPPLLVDRGLAAALGELAQQSVVPVDLRVDVDRELAPHVETTVYFVVAEALTNVNKHSGADRAEVAVVAGVSGVVAVVRDDGRGGAHLAKGSGLAGLQQRLLGVDGQLVLESRDGDGTTLTGVVPTRE